MMTRTRDTSEPTTQQIDALRAIDATNAVAYAEQVHAFNLAHTAIGAVVQAAAVAVARAEIQEAV